MSYSGDVVVSGPWQTRELDHLTIRKLAVGPMNNNVYLLTCRATGVQTLIDPAAEVDLLLELVRAGSASTGLDRILVTHEHADHVGALKALVEATGAPVVCGSADAEQISKRTGVTITDTLQHGDVLQVGDCELDVIGLRGHTPGSIALAYTPDNGRAHLFTGDSLFPGGVGGTHSPSNFTSLIDDVTERIFAGFDDDTWVYPGHGGDTTLGVERPQLAEWRARGW